MDTQFGYKLFTIKNLDSGEQTVVPKHQLKYVEVQGQKIKCQVRLRLLKVMNKMLKGGMLCYQSKNWIRIR